MWIVTDQGFYSIVHKRFNPAGVVTVRGRRREDLERFCEGVKSASAIQEDENADYRFRVTADQEETASWIGKQVLNIHYDNFKNHIGTTQSWARERIYANVWSALLGLGNLKE
ncbi:MAG: hypothetical protein IT308_08770 [Anaerolineaceae bacterium]|nr:hypothetical protein [Anaerolineaceae bacterium]